MNEATTWKWGRGMGGHLGLGIWSEVIPTVSYTRNKQIQKERKTEK